jgi:hypothetical protein
MPWNAQALNLLFRFVSYSSMASMCVDSWFFFQTQAIVEIHDSSFLMNVAHFSRVLIVSWRRGLQVVELKQVRRQLEKEKVLNCCTHF